MATTTASWPALSRNLSKPLGSLGVVAVLGLVGLTITAKFPSAQPLAAVVLASVLAVVIWMFFSERYEWSLVILMVYLGLADGYLKLSTNSSHITLVRDLLLYAIVIGALVRMAMRREAVRWPPLSGWVIAWVVVVLIQVANPDNGTLRHSVESIRPHAEWVPLFFLGYLVMRSNVRLRAFLLLLVAIAAINGVVSLVQANLTTEQLASWGPGYSKAIEGEEGGVSGRHFTDSNGEEHNRPFALGGDSGFGGIVGLLAVPAALALLALVKRRRLQLTVALLAGGVILAVATSASRTAVLGSILAIFVFAILTVTSRAGFRTVLVLGLIVALGYGAVGIFTGGAEKGSYSRYENISSPGKALSTAFGYKAETFERIPEYAVDYPLGSGFGRNGPAGSLPGSPGPGLDAESEATYLLIEVGIPGLVVLFGFFLTLLYLCVTRIRKLEDREMRILLTGIAAPLFAIFATAYVGGFSAITPAAPYFWLSAGVLAYWLKGAGYRELTKGTRRNGVPLST